MLWDPAATALLAIKTATLNSLPAIASPVYGVDAAMASTMFIDTAGTTQAASGQQVAKVRDAFGRTDFAFEQYLASERPLLLSGLAGGKPGLRFDGTSDYMYLEPQGAAGVPFQGRSFTIAATYRRNRTDGQAGGVFAAGSANGGAGGNGYDMLLLEAGTDGLPGLIRGSANEHGAAYLNSPSYTNGQLDKIVARASQANGIELRSRSSSGAFSGTANMPASGDSYTWDVCALGAELSFQGSGYPSYRFQGDIMELRFWASRATDAQFSQLQAYLDAKWGA